MINEKSQKVENGFHEPEEDEIFPEVTSDKLKEVKKIKEIIQSKFIVLFLDLKKLFFILKKIWEIDFF